MTRTPEEPTAHVVDRENLPHSATAHRFEGYLHGGANVSFFLIDADRGGGPDLHTHPYAEVFVIKEGEVTFTAGDETIEAKAGQIVVVPAGVPHKYVNSGVGSGHYEEEALGLGIPFPPQKERFVRLEETLQIALRMWSGEHGDERPFAGEHYRLERPLNLPQSTSRPHPPIMIAGDGEKKTLRLVARYADACSLRPGSQVPAKLDVLRHHCEMEGRDYDTIEKTCAFRFDVGERGEKVEELIGQLRWLSGMGIETVIGFVPSVDRIKPLDIIGSEVIPAVAGDSP